MTPEQQIKRLEQDRELLRRYRAGDSDAFIELSSRANRFMRKLAVGAEEPPKNVDEFIEDIWTRVLQETMPLEGSLLGMLKLKVEWALGTLKKENIREEKGLERVAQAGGRRVAFGPVEEEIRELLPLWIVPTRTLPAWRAHLPESSTCRTWSDLMGEGHRDLVSFDPIVLAALDVPLSEVPATCQALAQAARAGRSIVMLIPGLGPESWDADMHLGMLHVLTAMGLPVGSQRIRCPELGKSDARVRWLEGELPGLGVWWKGQHLAAAPTELVPAKVVAPWTMHALRRYDGGEGAAVALFMGPGKILLLPSRSSGPPTETSELAALRSIVASVRDAPTVVRLVADLDRRGKFKGNFFTTAGESAAWHLGPKLASLVWAFLEARTPDGVAADAEIKRLMMTEISTFKEKDELGTLRAQVNASFQKHLAGMWDKTPYPLFDDQGKTTRLRFLDQFAEVRGLEA